jgi:DNA invertase Pin-like site-specific DNA recombinase
VSLKDRGGAGLVVYRLDRLARDLMMQEQLLAEVRRLGAKVLSTSKGARPDGSSVRFWVPSVSTSGR